MVNFISEINRKLARSEVLAVFADDAIDDFRFKEYSVDVDFYVWAFVFVSSARLQSTKCTNKGSGGGHL